MYYKAVEEVQTCETVHVRSNLGPLFFFGSFAAETLACKAQINNHDVRFTGLGKVNVLEAGPVFLGSSRQR